MRPVDKGEKPDVVFIKYQDAKPYLIERIGEYCSFCEFPIKHVPEVEHKAAKSNGGALLEWDNLLLSCKYCNTRKSTNVGLMNVSEYVWPDEDDTFHIYCYKNGMPKVNYAFLDDYDEKYKKKAENLYQLVKLDNIPSTPQDKDQRWKKRMEAFNTATDCLKSLERLRDNSENEESYINLICKLAVESGFFSVWMEVFSDYTNIKDLLVQKYVGTRKELF